MFLEEARSLYPDIIFFQSENTASIEARHSLSGRFILIPYVKFVFVAQIDDEINLLRNGIKKIDPPGFDKQMEFFMRKFNE